MVCIVLHLLSPNLHETKLPDLLVNLKKIDEKSFHNMKTSELKIR